MIRRKLTFNKSFFIGVLLGYSLIWVIKYLSAPNSADDWHPSHPTLSTQTYQKILDGTDCSSVALKKKKAQRGQYWVMYNYVKASKEFKCYESVTYATQGTYDFLHNLEELVKKWDGPISVAVHAPGYDLRASLDTIAYLRRCKSPLIRKLVTFHLFFEFEHRPVLTRGSRRKPIEEAYKDWYDCKSPPPSAKREFAKSYRTLKKIPYAINVARNIARESAQTHFVFSSDIELFPSRNFIQQFLRMVSKNPSYMKKSPPKVFVLPIFEITNGSHIPETKTELLGMFENKTAIIFHKRLCSRCHLVIKGGEWMTVPETDELAVFANGQRSGKFRNWEPFFVGTNDDPLFDEKLTWEGQSNKMTQGFTMCLLEYDFLILNNAFVVHSPGIKKFKAQIQQHKPMILKTNKNLHTTTKEQIEAIYGTNPNCIL